MKTFIVLCFAIVGLAGCSTYEGGTGTPYGTSSGMGNDTGTGMSPTTPSGDIRTW